MTSLDTISISNLSIHLSSGLGRSAFSLADHQTPPCSINLTISISLSPTVIPHCVQDDKMPSLGINYSSISKEIYSSLSNPSKTYTSPLQVLDIVADIVTNGTHGGGEFVEAVEISLEIPRALLHAESTFYRASYSSERKRSSLGFKMEGLRTECVIGLHAHERRERQRVEVDMEVLGLESLQRWDHKAFSDLAYEFLSSSSFGTIEALADSLVFNLISSPPLSRTSPHSSPGQATPEIRLTLRKPSALPFAVPSITVQRSLSDYTARGVGGIPALRNGDIQLGRGELSDLSSSQNFASSSKAAPRIFIALGSNIGDRVGHIKRAVRALEGGGCVLKDCSRLYESEPMYVEDQDRFINGAVEISTTLTPIELLHLLKRTERAVGRTKTFTNGPRVIDLDLIFYGDEVVQIGAEGDPEDGDGVGWLECPHASLREREFVLRPLADMAADFRHPLFGVNISTLLSRLPQTNPPQLSPIIPFPAPALPLRLSVPSSPAIMAIFNATPDSFSDGDPNRTSASSAFEAVLSLINIPDCPAIVDIGGMSTRPHSTPCTEEQEMSRVIPLISLLRSSPHDLRSTGSIPLSIDTYRPHVARKAVDLGASCINDVRGGREEGMLKTMAELDVPVILMHSRGDSTTMTQPSAQDYSQFGGVIQGVQKELGETIRKALDAGVKRWNILIDPGLGFAKSHEDNLFLLKNLDKVVGEHSELFGYPMVVGASRKGFVGRVIGRSRMEEAASRGFGDAAVNSWCVMSGVVDVLRVHEPRGAGESVKMSLAIRDA